MNRTEAEVAAEAAEAHIRKLVARYVPGGEDRVLSMLGYGDYTPPPPRPSFMPLDKDVIDRLRLMRKAGRRVVDIAGEFKVTKATVYRHTKGYEKVTGIDYGS